MYTWIVYTRLVSWFYFFYVRTYIIPVFWLPPSFFECSWYPVGVLHYIVLRRLGPGSIEVCIYSDSRRSSPRYSRHIDTLMIDRIQFYRRCFHHFSISYAP